MRSPAGEVLHLLIDMYLQTGEYDMARQVLEAMIKAHREIVTEQLEKGFGTA